MGSLAISSSRETAVAHLISRLSLRFPHYDEFQDFLVGSLGKLDGVRRLRTMMVLSIKKEMGQKIGEVLLNIFP